jgi:hypothetical protein
MHPALELNLNQSNLQDLMDCPRRFQLRMLDNLSWPAANTSSLDRYEQSTFIGNQFHLLCHQYFSGIPKNNIFDNLTAPSLKNMFDNFLPFGESLLEFKPLSEHLLVSSFNQHSIIAKFDLIAEIEPGNFLIIDWKTSPTKPSRQILLDRVQTKLYPYVFNSAGPALFPDSQISPDSIEMLYWYPLCDEPRELFTYSDQLHLETKEFIENSIIQIGKYQSSDKFPLTEDLSHCRFCPFRSLCDRGITPGNFENYLPIDQEDLSNEHFDMNDFNEIEY